MKAIERAAIARVLIDLIKADKVIDSREMDLYRDLKVKFGISRNDEIAAYAISLSQAVNILKDMETGIVSDLLGTFEDMTFSDGFCAREEALLMLMLKFCLAPGEPECDVISTLIEESWFDERQVLYVESHHAKDVNFAISSNYRAIARELKLCGLDFVYLPQILHHYITTPRELLNEVVALLSPSLSESAIAGLLMKIKLFKTDTFCIEQLHHKLGFKELADTPPALLFRISHSKVGNQILTNFLRLELSADVLPTVQNLVDTFLTYNGSDRIVVSHKKDEKGRFLYNGFYRQVFEILLLQKAVMCHLEIDFVHGSLSFPEIDVTLSGLHRKEKALYTLFVFEACLSGLRNEGGGTQLSGGINFTPPESARLLQKFNRRMKLLQRKYAKIYAAFGGEEKSAPDITKAEIRLPMISGIRRSINKQSEKIYDAQRFMVTRDKNGFYGISANPDMFLYKDFHNPEGESFIDSPLFEQLSALT